MNIKELDWNWVPYDWRPGQIWYYLKCWAWHRYTTVKPRYLGHTWCDRTELMPNMMFEILCQFVEEECSPGWVEWYGEVGQKITVGGQEKYVMDEMRELIKWWHEDWHKIYPEVGDLLWAEAGKHLPIQEYTIIEGADLLDCLPQFKTEEDETIYNLCMAALNKLEQNMYRALADRLHRIIPLIPFMWT